MSARIGVGAVVLFAIGWALVFTIVDTATWPGEALKAATSATATWLMVLSTRSAAPVFGRRGTRVAVAAVAAWWVSDLSWIVLSRVDGFPVDLLNLGYASSALLLATAALFGSAGGARPRGRLTRSRVVVDVVTLAACSIMLWSTLSWTDTSAPPTIGALALASADSILLVAALWSWARSPEDRRRALGLLSLAAGGLYATDLAYGADLLSDSYIAGGGLDFSWAVFVGLVGSIAVIAPPGSRPFVPGLARWVGACLPPVAALLTLFVAIVDDQDRRTFVLDFMTILLVLILVVRTVLYTAEQFALYDRLSEASQRQAHLADHDDLTGVLARRAFLERARAVVARHRRLPGGVMGLAWLDIDDFKRVNDTFGHSAGDRVLRTVARRLQLASAPGDVVGRMGGDEFVVLRPDLTGSAERWGEHLAAVVSTPIDVSGTSIQVACSAGVVRSTGTDDLGELIVDGDLALLQAKRSGRAQVFEFVPSASDALTDAKRMAGHVQVALAHRDLVVRYQPIVDLRTGRTVSAEALVRMPGPHGAELAPHEFLQYVELQGLLPQLFVIVLERALADFSSTDCRVSVNVTTSDITSPGFVDLVAGALRNSGTDPRQLVLELNERVAPQRRIVEAVRGLELIGVQFALDDFGTQWSHLDQVRELAPAFVKLDRDLVSDRQSVLSGAVALARSFGARVVAEGIETEAQLVAARNAGADYGQGWYWAKDLPMGEFRSRLNGTPTPSA